MSGVYGDMLLYFPEQFRDLTVFEMEPGINGGWTRTANSDQRITGVFQNTSGNRIKDGNGNMVNSGGLELWAATKKLAGKFTMYEDQVYRINVNANWNFEGGFQKYSLEKVVGNNGTESDNTTWNTGAGSFC